MNLFEKGVVRKVGLLVLLKCHPFYSRSILTDIIKNKMNYHFVHAIYYRDKIYYLTINILLFLKRQWFSTGYISRTTEFMHVCFLIIIIVVFSKLKLNTF